MLACANQADIELIVPREQSSSRDGPSALRLTCVTDPTEIGRIGRIHTCAWSCPLVIQSSRTHVNTWWEQDLNDIVVPNPCSLALSANLMISARFTSATKSSQVAPVSSSEITFHNNKCLSFNLLIYITHLGCFLQIFLSLCHSVCLTHQEVLQGNVLTTAQPL